MRILQVMAGAERGGAETAFVDMCIALHEAGETVAVVTRSNDLRVSHLQQAGLPVHMLPFGGAVDIYTSWRLRRIIKDFKPDIVQTWMARGAAKTPAWDEAMGIGRYLVNARLGGYYKMKYFKSVDYFTAITPAIADYLVHEGVRPERVRQINNFAEVEAAGETLSRAALGVPEGAKLVVALGRLHVSKAFDVLIDAVAALPGVYLWIAGEGPERAALEDQIARSGAADRIRLLGWSSDRAALFQACDACAFISRYEPFGTVFVQAWAQRVPVIVSDADGPRQFVRPDTDAVMVPVDDRAATTAALSRVLSDENLRTALIENGYRQYVQDFTKEECLRRYLGYYHDMRRTEGLL